MPGQWKGVYENRKWASSTTVQFLSDIGISPPIRYPRAIVDTGSPFIIFPGTCPMSPSDAVTLPDIVHVQVAANSAEYIDINLSPRGRVFQCGGVGGTLRDRYVFCADVTVTGLEFPDLVSVIFFDPIDLSYTPIISIDLIIQYGHSVVFSREGFRMQ